jgi:hypothetical protein
MRIALGGIGFAPEMITLTSDHAAHFISSLLKRKLQMPKSLTEIRSLARSHTRTALNVLVGVMRNTKAAAPARIAAANAILDRGWGKATQPVGNDGDAFELIHRIERVIVHPENTDSQDI